MRLRVSGKLIIHTTKKENKMCNCERVILEKVKEHMEEKIKHEIGFIGIDKTDFKNAVFTMVDFEPKAPFTIPIEIEYKRMAKASGKVREYKKKTFIIPTYCPFCGEKYSG